MVLPKMPPLNFLITSLNFLMKNRYDAALPSRPANLRGQRALRGEVPEFAAPKTHLRMRDEHEKSKAKESKRLATKQKRDAKRAARAQLRDARALLQAYQRATSKYYRFKMRGIVREIKHDNSKIAALKREMKQMPASTPCTPIAISSCVL